MKYLRKPTFGPLAEIVETDKPLEPYEVAELIKGLAHTLTIAHLHETEKVKFEDGRKDWMVRYEKYYRLRTENRKLKLENERLRKAIIAVSTEGGES